MKEFLFVASNILEDDFDYIIEKSLGADFRLISTHDIIDRIQKNINIEIKLFETYHVALNKIRKYWDVYLPRKRTVLAEKTMNFNENLCDY